MSPQFRLGSDEVRDLAALCHVSLERLKKFLQVLQGPQLPVRPNDLVRLAQDSMQIDDQQASLTIRPLLAFSNLIRSGKIDLDSLMRGVSDALPDENDVKSRWSERDNVLRELIECDAVHNVSKATELAYEYTNLMQFSRIMTDVRPVFNHDASKIVSAVVSFTLRLYYENRRDESSISLALDEADVIRLRAECDRALNKAKIAKTMMKSVPTVIAGESDDA